VATVGVSGLLLRGQVVTPDQSFAGEVLIAGDTITCVDASCAGAAGAATATVLETGGLIYPGLIDTHNHILFDIFDETDWSPNPTSGRPYTNHNQWTNEALYKGMVDCKQYLNGEGSTSPLDLGCEMDKYGELKGLMAGTTSIVGAANPANRACYGTLARTVDQSANGLASDDVQVATLLPANFTSVCGNIQSGSTKAYLIHIAEGVDQSALNEFYKLGDGGCPLAPQTTIVHGAALGDPEFTAMAAAGMHLTWSPQSNVFLYGSNTDLTKTANIPLARSKGIEVSLAPDWSIGGSQNLLDELRFARKVDQANWGGSLTALDLVHMVTTNPAHALGLGALLGSIEVGKKADLMVIDGDPTQPYESLFRATPREVRLVLVGGKPLYGDTSVQAAAQASPVCDVVDACCRPKFACVAAAGSTTANKFGQSLDDVTTAIATALTDYDADATHNPNHYTFSPIAPLVKCP
jgi:hypothetical protein